MPSQAHQLLLVWAARRMVRDGYYVCGFDGRAPRGEEWSALPAPFEIGHVRADAWGQRPVTQGIAFGEAKTFADVDTAHTRRQLGVLGKAKMKGRPGYCPIYIAVPHSAVYELDRVLIDVGLIRAKHIVRVHVPDVLLEDTLDGSGQESIRTPA